MDRFYSRFFGICVSLFLVPAMVVLTACREHRAPVSPSRSFSMMDDSLIHYNQQIVATETREIEDFIQRYRWEMRTTPTGLRYQIYSKSEGPAPTKGSTVTIKYKLKKLDGTLLTMTKEGETMAFETGRHAVVNGLEEGILLMHSGDRARLIVPSHLAFGLLGDFEKVPMRTVLLYDVELVSVKKSR